MAPSPCQDKVGRRKVCFRSSVAGRACTASLPPLCPNESGGSCLMDAARTANGWPVARGRPGALTSTNRSHVPIFRGEYQGGGLESGRGNVRFAGFGGSYDRIDARWGTSGAVYNRELLGYHVRLVGSLNERIYHSDSRIGPQKALSASPPCGLLNRPFSLRARKVKMRPVIPSHGKTTDHAPAGVWRLRYEHWGRRIRTGASRS